MKTITIRLPDVEAAMLLELQKSKQEFKLLDKLIASLIRNQYQALPPSRSIK